MADILSDLYMMSATLQAASRTRGGSPRTRPLVEAIMRATGSRSMEQSVRGEVFDNFPNPVFACGT